MVQSFDQSALQLFQQEQRELLEQVGQSLTALANDPSPAELQRLRRFVRLIHQGAVQMGIAAIAQHTTQFLQLLQPHITQPGVDLLPQQMQTFTQLFQTLQRTDLAVPDPPPGHEPQAQPKSGEKSLDKESLAEKSLELDLDKDLSFPPDFSDFLAEDPTSGEEPHVSPDIHQLLLQHDIAEAIARIERNLPHLADRVIMADTTAQLDALLGWGEVLDWPELIAMTHALIESLQTYPVATSAIVRIGILGLQALHQSATQPSTLLPKDTAAEGGTASIPASPEHEPYPYSFKTERKFIWQSHQTIFVIDLEAIAETLMPQSKDILTQQGQPTLRWNEHLLTIVHINRLLARSTATSESRDAAPPQLPSSSSLGPILVIPVDGNVIALEIEPEQFIRQSELTLTPLAETAEFYLGTTSIGGQDNLVLVDVLALLSNCLASLPSVKDNPVAPSVTAQNSANIQSTVIASPPPSISDPRILVVDDSRTIRYLLQQVLEKAGYRVTLAEDGLEAIEQLKQHPEIHLMISDVEMPRLTGFELLSRCRQHQQWKTLPIIILSQCPTDQHHQLSEQFGANSYLPKPFDHDKMLSLVDELITAHTS